MAWEIIAQNDKMKLKSMTSQKIRKQLTVKLKIKS